MLPQTVMPFGIAVATPFSHSIFSSYPCLANSYYGVYGSGASAVFLPDESCFASLSSELLSCVSPAASLSPHDRLFWIEEIQVDPALKSASQPFDAALTTLVELGLSSSQAYNFQPQAEQHTYSTSLGYTGAATTAVWASPSSAVISTSHSIATLETLIPRFWRAIPLPLWPIPVFPIPPAAINVLEGILANLSFNPDVAAIVNNISIPRMRNDIRFLTGEDGKSGIVSRHSFADGSKVAAEWLKERFEDAGATCSLQVFMTGFAPNVICRYAAAVETTATVIIGAHYDSRGSFGSTRAPGANDDGSGTVALLAIAHVLGRRARLRFRSNVEIIAFAGEEQGLLGSRDYAFRLRECAANVTLMIQADMIGYRVLGEPPQLGLPALFEVPVANQLVANISAIYSPELTVGPTSACCSDHQSFFEQGFASTELFERAGPIADPMYHNSGDLSDREGFDFEQIKSIAKVQFATLLHTAGFGEI